MYANNESIEVVPSGTVGKYAIAVTKPVMLVGVILTPGTTSAANVVVRDGAQNASGDVKLNASRPVNDSQFFPLGVKLTHGVHVKVTPSNAKAYLIIK